jgi:glycine cleavage system transcriptional repressor
MSNDTESLVITASGEDKIGLVEGFTRRISDPAATSRNRMAALGGRFALLMRITGSWDACQAGRRLPAVGEELGAGDHPAAHLAYLPTSR